VLQSHHAPPIGTCPANTGKDKAKMSNRLPTNFFMVSSFKAYAGFYQQLAASALSIHELGNKLIRHAEHARAFRQTEQVSELGLMLANLPLRKFQTAGHYYLGWAMYRSGNNEQSKVMLEQVAESGTEVYQARALLSLGTLEATKQDFPSETRYYHEAFKASHDLHTKVEAVRGLAVIKAKEGYHGNSIKDFERFLPLAASCDAPTYNIYISSLAVELGEAGRKDEARNIIKHVLASPFAFAYPEWLETAEELKPANRSFIVPDPSPQHMGKLLSMPVVEQAKPQRLDRPWKKKMGKDDDDRYGLTPEQLKEMTPSEKLCYILNSINPDFTDEDFDRVIDLVDEINDKKKK
jgi:tetratricopeptide (TPR) repeat protein